VLRQLVRFGLVGALATGVHFVVTVAVVRVMQLHPLAANAIGFAIAFGASYLGQRHWTFGGDGGSRNGWRRTLPRYFAVSLLGFGVNAAAFAAILAFTPLRYEVALALVLAGVALLTYGLSRAWAFGGG
jgi:putative flippase GtrA